MSRPAGILARGPWAPEAVTVSWSDEPYDAGPIANAAADGKLRELAHRDSPTHDGDAARMAALDVHDEGVHMECEPMRWSLRLTDDASDAISSLCVVRDGDGRWLAGRRAAWVATWPRRWALGAGGAVEVGESPSETLGRELEEEWGLTPDPLTVEAVLRIPSGMIMVVGLAWVPARAEVVMDSEHEAYEWWPAEIGDWPAHAEEPLRMMASLIAG